MSCAFLQGDCLTTLPAVRSASVHCAITSPPYFGLRDYGMPGQIGLEASLNLYIDTMVRVFREVRRVLRDDGTLWLNMGDSYNGQKKRGPIQRMDGSLSYRAGGRSISVSGFKRKDLMGVPWRLALALQDDGWFLRQDIIWAKSNPMPESVRDRCVKSHEYLFLLTKSERYYFDPVAIREPASGSAVKNTFDRRTATLGKPGKQRQHRLDREPESFSDMRNKRSVWSVATQSYRHAHFACFPEKLVQPCIFAGTSERGCCPTCGTPWQRVVERTRVPTRPGRSTKIGSHGELVVGNRDPLRHVVQVRTVGWEPACKCPAHEPRPCVVLDPFGGSGTTACVAHALGRDSVSCELNPDYIEIAHERFIKKFPADALQFAVTPLAAPLDHVA